MFFMPINLTNRAVRYRPATGSYERSGSRLKTREDSSVRWVDLLDKFKNVQEKAKRHQRASQRQFEQDSTGTVLKQPSLIGALSLAAATDQQGGREKIFPDVPKSGFGNTGLGISGRGPEGRDGRSTPTSANKSRTSLSHLSRLGIGGKKRH
jgi:vacuole morphology and inheritance protein 14